MNWWVTQCEWVTIKAIFVRECVCICACVWLCLPCLPACLPVDACVQLCVKLASSSRVMNQIKHTHSDTRSNTHTHTHTAGSGPSWRAPAGCDFDPHHNIRSSTPTLLFCYSSVSRAPQDTYPRLKLLLSDPQIELGVRSNTEDPPVVTGHSVCSIQIWSLQMGCTVSEGGLWLVSPSQWPWE